MADILPLPSLALDAARAIFGETSDAISVHDYRDAAGNLLFSAVFGYGVRRYMRREGDKWVKCRRPALCPLYRLPQITRSEVADVWLVPDERDADRLTRLGLLASRLPAKDTDIAPLAERSIVLWGGILTGGNAASIQRNATVKRLAAITSRLTVVDPGLDLPNVWLGDHPDATRAHIADLTTVTLADLRRRKEVRREMAPPPAPSVEAMALAAAPKIEVNGDEKSAHVGNVTFVLNKSGLWAYETKADGGTSTVYLGARFDILAKTRSCDSGGWGRLLQWRDADGKTHRIAIPISAAHGDSVELFRSLADQGLELRAGGRVRSLLEAYLVSWPVEERAKCVDSIGWVDESFVTPERIFGREKEPIVYQSTSSIRPSMRTGGTLEGWQREVCGLAAGNTRIVFAISAALAGPLLKPTRTISGGFHLLATSSRGKSTALKAAASVWGPSEDFKREWRTTDNGLEALAVQHNDLTLILDEIGQCSERDIGASAYMLANGQGKSRMTKGISARPAATWRLLFLSAGEESIAQRMEAAGKRAMAGQLLRCPNIPAEPGGEKNGIVEDLHGRATSRELVNAISAGYGANYGHAGQAWLEYLTAKPDEAERLAKKFRADWLKENLPTDADGQIARVAERFGLVAAAGELASLWGMTGWVRGEAFEASSACFRAWHAFEGPTHKRAVDDALAQVRSLLEQNAARFVPDDASPASIRGSGTIWGFRRKISCGQFEPDRFEWLVLPSVFKNELCKGRDPRIVEKLLVEAGWQAYGTGGRSRRYWSSPIGGQWFHPLTSKVFEDDRD